MQRSSQTEKGGKNVIFAEQGNVIYRENFVNNRRNASRVNRRKKRNALNKEIDAIDKSGREGRVKDSYRGIRKIKNGYQARSKIVRGTDGSVKIQEERVLEIWKEFFYDLLNREERPDIIERAHIPEVDMHIEEPTIDCVRKAIKSLKNNKAPGLDNISAELIKHGGEILEFQLFKLIIKIWRVEAIPNDWDTGNIIPVHKKGDKTVRANYRGITLLPVCYKVLTIIIKEKLEPYIENGLGDYQSGFRKGRSTIDHIFTIRQIMEKCWEYNKNIWQIFVDFKQAYDSINRASLWNIMAEFNIPSKLIKLVKACYNNSKACVQVGQRRTTEFGIKSGLRQGCLLSPILFNMVLEKVKRSIDEIQGGVDIGGVYI